MRRREHQPIAGALQPSQVGEASTRDQKKDARGCDDDARDASPPDPLAQEEEREDSERERKHGDDPPGVGRRCGDHPRDLHQEVERENRAAQKKGTGVAAREPQRHAFHDQNATQEGKSDCQAQGEDLDRTELRQ